MLVELQHVSLDSLSTLSRRLEELAQELPAVAWVELEPFLQRAVFAIDPARAHEITRDQLVALVERAERECPAVGEPLPRGRELPDDDVIYLQRWVELLADVGGLGSGLLLRFVPFAPAMLGSNAAFLIWLVRSQPRLRRPLDERLGHDRADLVLNLALAAAQGLSQRPMASIVDISLRVSTLRELHGRRSTFARSRGDLFQSRTHPDLSPRSVAPQRPVGAPLGPLESYSKRLWVPAAAAFSVSLLTSRSVSRATSALFSTLPKPAHYGRDIFALEVGRTLAKQGTLVLDPQALARLDRIDCLVVDGGLLTDSRFRIGEIITLAGEDAGEAQVDAASDAREAVRALFDRRNPLAVQVVDDDALGPPRRLGLELEGEALTHYQALCARGALVLALTQADRLVALAEVNIRKGLGIEELLATAHQAGLRVVVATDGDELAHMGQDYEQIAAGAKLSASIAGLQRSGCTVCYVSDGASPALAQADCAVGIHRQGEPAPWGAHIVCGASLQDLRTLLNASLLSRGVSKQSVQVAIATAALGTLVSAAGRGRSSRQVMFVVNLATLVAMLNALRSSSPLDPDVLKALPDPTPWHALEAQSVLARVGSQGHGLSQLAAVKRRRDGQRDPSAIRELSSAISHELLNPLAPLLAAGAGLSAMVGSSLDAGIVAGVGGMNALVGGVQRFRAERAIRKLVHPVDQHISALRDGRPRRLSALELVPGDVLELSAGELVPADCRLLEVRDLEIDSSSLTGESMPTPKQVDPSFEPAIADRSCMLYAGTEVLSGSARAVVVAVGAMVEAQRAARSGEGQAPVGGLETRLHDLMELTGPLAASGGLAVMLAGLLRGRRPQELVVSGVSMAVAAIPEGLPVLATAAQLSTAQRLSARGVVVRNARSIEALGRVDVICLDKTGTLTDGLIELSRVTVDTREFEMDALDDEARAVVLTALRASAGRIAGSQHQNPTDAALYRAAGELGIRDVSDFHPRSVHPFESTRGYHAVVGRASVEKGNDEGLEASEPTDAVAEGAAIDASDAGELACVKGAPERVLERCSHILRGGQRRALSDAHRAALVAQASTLASEGLRVLAVAARHADAGALDVKELAGLTFHGMLAFRDPPRATAAATIRRLRAAGVEVVMLTGDHLQTARRIARDVDLLGERDAITGGEISRFEEGALAERVCDIGVFARVTPAQKVQIVRALQQAGRAVAMVGDGANDAPALRAADVGVALGERSTQAARAAADIVFTEAGIEVLWDAVIEARAMWASVRDAVSILVGGNLGEVGFGVLGGFVSGRPPLNPRQLLVVNFLTDVAPAIAVALRQPSPETYAELTRGRPDELFESGLNRDITIRALSTGLGATWAWGAGRLTGTRARASTMALVALVCTQLGQTLLSRGSDNRVGWTSAGSLAVLAAIIQTPGLSHMFGCRPMGPIGWGMALTSSAVATASSVAIARLDDYVRDWLAGAYAEEPEPMRVEVRAVSRVVDKLPAGGAPILSGSRDAS